MKNSNNNQTVLVETKRKPNTPKSDTIKSNSSSKPVDPKPKIKPVPTIPKEPKKS